MTKRTSVLLIVLGFLCMMTLSMTKESAGQLVSTHENLFGIILTMSMMTFGLGVLSSGFSLLLKLVIKSPDFAAMMTKAVSMFRLFDLLIWKEVRDEAKQRADARRF